MRFLSYDADAEMRGRVDIGVRRTSRDDDFFVRLGFNPKRMYDTPICVPIFWPPVTDDHLKPKKSVIPHA